MLFSYHYNVVSIKGQAYVIGRFSAFYEKHWTFCDRFPWRKYFAPDAAMQTSAE